MANKLFKSKPRTVKEILKISQPAVCGIMEREIVVKEEVYRGGENVCQN